MSRVALLCLVLVGCSAPFTAATTSPDAAVDASPPPSGSPWPASQLDGAGPAAHEFGDDDAALDVADAGVTVLADDAAAAPDTALDWSSCTTAGPCGGSWERFLCGDAGPPAGSHCSAMPVDGYWCCYDTTNLPN